MRDVVIPETLAAAAELHAPAVRRGRVRMGIASRALVLVVLFVLLAEVTIYLPWIANVRNNFLRNRLSAAYTAALVLEAAPRAMVPDALSQQLLDSVGARIIVLQRNGTRRILAVSQLPPSVDETTDLRNSTWADLIAGAVRTLLAPDGRVLTVVGEAPMGGDAIELTMDEAPLKSWMRNFNKRILLISLISSAIVASLAVAAIHFFILRPVRRLTTSLMDFGADPEDASRIIVPSGHNHEIGHAEEALAVMQEALVRELNQKKHLAALGLAVAKISHDMRDMLAAAQLLSDRLTNVKDPLAQRLAPKLVATLDRAIRFCRTTLTYGRAADEPPKLRSLALHSLVAEAVETVALSAQGRVEIINEVPEDFEISADAEQIFRVLANLIRNGVEALENAGPTPGLAPHVVVRAWHASETAVIEVADTGPGVPLMARPKLFNAFLNSTRPGGTGLGLAIAADLVHAHGGTISLVAGDADDERGAVFQITLPARTM